MSKSERIDCFASVSSLFYVLSLTGLKKICKGLKKGLQKVKLYF